MGLTRLLSHKSTFDVIKSTLFMELDVKIVIMLMENDIPVEKFKKCLNTILYHSVLSPLEENPLAN